MARKNQHEDIACYCYSSICSSATVLSESTCHGYESQDCSHVSRLQKGTGESFLVFVSDIRAGKSFCEILKWNKIIKLHLVV